MTSLWLDRPPIPSDPLVVDAYDVVVVGAGLTGLTTGLLLAEAGHHVLILEAREVGAVTTGNTTGKLSLLQGTTLSRMRGKQSRDVVQAYVDGNADGQRWLLDFCADNDVPVQRRDAITYASEPGTEVAAARKEYDAAREAGLPVRWVDDLPLPVPHAGGVVLADQAQFDPMDVLAALADRFREAGGTLVTGARVVGAGLLGAPEVTLADGRRVRARDVVLATGTPILDRGLYFAKLEPKRSYCLSFAYPDPPQVMALSTSRSTRSLRDVPTEGGDPLLIVGGAGHPVGRARSERAHLDRLRGWTMEHFPGAVETHSWSAQDYGSHDGIPYVGPMPRGGGHIFVATGYDKWGMSNAVMAALELAQELQDGTPSWAQTMRHRVTGPTAAAELVKANAAVGLAGAMGVLGVALQTEGDTAPAEGEGSVARDGLIPTGTATVNGRTCRVTALCTHLGGVLAWNDAEQSWDCPLHGSRFAADGEVLEGPATKPLHAR